MGCILPAREVVLVEEVDAECAKLDFTMRSSSAFCLRPCSSSAAARTSLCGMAADVGDGILGAVSGLGRAGKRRDGQCQTKRRSLRPSFGSISKKCSVGAIRPWCPRSCLSRLEAVGVE